MLRFDGSGSTSAARSIGTRSHFGRREHGGWTAVLDIRQMFVCLCVLDGNLIVDKRLETMELRN